MEEIEEVAALPDFDSKQAVKKPEAKPKPKVSVKDLRSPELRSVETPTGAEVLREPSDEYRVSIFKPSQPVVRPSKPIERPSHLPSKPVERPSQHELPSKPVERPSQADRPSKPIEKLSQADRPSKPSERPSYVERPSYGERPSYMERPSTPPESQVISYHMRLLEQQVSCT
jgi:hypothetical protein